MDKKGIGELCGKSFNLLNLLRFLPDMVEQLRDNQIKSNLYRGTLGESVKVKSLERDEPPISPISIERNFSIDRLSKEARIYFLNRYFYTQEDEMKFLDLLPKLVYNN